MNQFAVTICNSEDDANLASEQMKLEPVGMQVEVVCLGTQHPTNTACMDKENSQVDITSKFERQIWVVLGKA